MSQAISEHTRGKQALVSSVMHAVLSWFKECKKGVRFTYFDMNAFKGIYSDEHGELKGSPVNFVETAQAIDIPTLSVLFEQNSGYYKALYQNMSQLWSRKHVVIPIHAACETLIAAALRYAIGAYGLIYADPCGAGVPFDVLAEIAVANVDLLIHLDGRVFLRQTGQRQTSSFSQQFAQLRALKKDWYIAPPVKTSTQSWAMLFGSSGSRHLVLHNLEERLGFKPLDSEEGQQFYNCAFAGGAGGRVGAPARSGVRSIPPRAKVTKVPAGVIKLVNGLAPKTRKAISVALRSDMSQPKIAEKHDVSIATVYGINKLDGVRSWGARTGSSPKAALRDSTPGKRPAWAVGRRLSDEAVAQAENRAARMPKKQRQLIERQLAAGMTYKQIAKAAGPQTMGDVCCVSLVNGGRYNKGTMLRHRTVAGNTSREQQAARRAEVRRLTDEGGLTAPQIAAKLDISLRTVFRDLIQPSDQKPSDRLDKQRSSGQSIDLSGRQTAAEMKRRRELVVKLRNKGLTVPEVVIRLNISRATVIRDSIGMPRKMFVRPEQSPLEPIRQNDAEIKESMRAVGIVATAKKFKICTEVLRRDYAGLVADLAEQRIRRIAERTEKSRELRKCGLSYRKIAKELGVSCSVITSNLASD